MWLPEQMPQLTEQLKILGLELDPEALADLHGYPMGAIVQIPGCSASFVSSKGLVITNHHCALGSIQHNSTPENDYINNGFLAKTMADEVPAAPGSYVWVTTEIKDVTSEVLGKLEAKMSDGDRYRRIEQTIKNLVARCEKPGGVRCDVRALNGGASYMKVTRMEIQDVRLVYAPAEGIGNYGDEIDNFRWPRHVGDFSFFRAYVGKDGKPVPYSAENVPYQPKHYLRVSDQGVDEGDLVIVPGYPGTTRRYLTADEFAYYFESAYPKGIEYFTQVLEYMHARSKVDEDARIRLKSTIGSVGNALTNYTGSYEGMVRSDMMSIKKKQTADLQKFIESTPERHAKYGGVVETINEIEVRRRAMAEQERVMLWLGRGSTLLSQATTLHRLALEREKKDPDRTPGFQQRDLSRIEGRIKRAQSLYEPGFEALAFKFFLLEASRLPGDRRVVAIDDFMKKTGKATPEEQADALIGWLDSNTQMKSLDVRLVMMKESPKQIRARADSYLQLAEALYPFAKEREKMEDEVQGAMTRVRPRYLEAIREMKGGLMYPDANSTLRITVGTVEGYQPQDGLVAMPQTTLSGIVAKDTGEVPFMSPKTLLDAAAANRVEGYVDPQLNDVPVNYLSNVDTTGGSSGSPILNKRGELIGLNFDGVWESIPADYVFDPKVVRSIHVDAVYMLWVMDYVDGAHNLLLEMGLPVHSR